ncbi:MAG: BatD family protein [Lentimicrobium sp.]|nr:BatD family protein [Lentimicrobium sp.]
MKIRNVIVMISLLLANIALFGQEIEFRATAKEVVSVGEQFRLIYSINGQASGFRSPVIKNFSILNGPNQSQSTSMQIINGQVSRSVEYSFTYILQATSEGTFTILPASVNVDGKTYQSNPVTIKVIKGKNTQAPQQNNQQNAAPTSGDITANDLFVRAVTSKSNPTQGEQIIVTYKLYTRVPVAEYSITRAPSTAGFWLQDLIKDSKKLNQYRETIEGKEYVVAEIKKDALFAQKSGTLTIEPLEMDVLAQVERKVARRNFNDPFFDSFFNDSFLGSTYQNVKKTIRSNDLRINVKPLPEQTRPGGYTGGVGEFNINAAIDREQLKANEALTLRFTVTGKGNIKLIEKPAIVFPPDFEVYDPRITDNITASSNGVSGSRNFEYLIIPRNAGKYNLKPINFSYFDLSSQSYKTISTKGFDITVEKGDGRSSDIIASTDKEDFRYIGSDVRFIKTGSIKLSAIADYFFGSRAFYIWLLTVPLLFALFIIIWRKELKKRSNVAFMKTKKATGVARKRLKTAERFMKQGKHEEFWAETSNALWGYMSDKFNIPRASLSIDSVNGALKSKNVKKELIDEFIAILNKCEFARFAPGNKTQAMDEIFKQSIQAITKTEQELK